MASSYFCKQCNRRHTFDDEIGAMHLKFALPQKDFSNFINFAFNAGAYGYITSNTQKYVRDVQVFDILQDKFRTSGIFSTPESAHSWLDQHQTLDHVDHILRRLQGDGGGEVDAMRQLNSTLGSLLYKTEFPANADGHIPSNLPGIDLHRISRITGEVVEKIQVKSNWSANHEVLHQTLNDFVNNTNYSPDITLAGPKELIEQAREMGLPNKLIIVNDVHGNHLSGERLSDLIQNHDSSVYGHFTFEGVSEHVVEGAAIAAIVRVGLSCIFNYISYRQGQISGQEAFHNIADDVGRGAITGGAMAGLSVAFPPGAAGIAVGIIIGSQVRRLVDIAYGKGAYKDILDSLGAVAASIKTTANGIAVIEKSISIADYTQKATIDELLDFNATSKDIDSNLSKLRKFRYGED